MKFKLIILFFIPTLLTCVEYEEPLIHITASTKPSCDGVINQALRQYNDVLKNPINDADHLTITVSRIESRLRVLAQYKVQEFEEMLLDQTPATTSFINDIDRLLGYIKHCTTPSTEEAQQQNPMAVCIFQQSCNKLLKVFLSLRSQAKNV